MPAPLMVHQLILPCKALFPYILASNHLTLVSLGKRVMLSCVPGKIAGAGESFGAAGIGAGMAGWGGGTDGGWGGWDGGVSGTQGGGSSGGKSCTW